MKHRSLAEVGRGQRGRAHRRSRIPRFSVLSNTPETWYWAAPRRTPPKVALGCRRQAGRFALLDVDLGTLLFEGGLDLLGLVLRHAFLDRLRRGIDEILGLLE